VRRKGKENKTEQKKEKKKKEKKKKEKKKKEKKKEKKEKEKRILSFIADEIPTVFSFPSRIARNRSG